MNIIFYLSLLAILLTLSSCGDTLKLVNIAPSYSAKEICSCLFVVERSLPYCQNAWESGGRVKGHALDIDYDKKTVKARFIIFTAKAQWIDLHQGCRLLN